MITLFAQANLDTVPATVFKYVFIVLIGLLVAAAFIYGALKRDGKREVKIDQDPTPEFRKAPKRYNFDLAEERHKDHHERIKQLEADVAAIQKSRAKSLAGIERRFNRIWIILTRIATKMDVETPTEPEEDLDT